MATIRCPRCGTINAEGLTACQGCGAGLPKVDIAIRESPKTPSRGKGAPRELQFRRGDVVANRYTVQGVIGRGGMGCIYRVQDNILNEEVALKMLLPHFVRDKLVIERFFNEARIARHLSHPNICRIHDIGVSGKVVYISMEYIKGRSLRDVLEGLGPGKRLPIQTVLHVFDELCAALEYAHERTIHRDIKPENVMIDTDGSVKLMDFGISKLMADTRLTATSIVMGTPYYMAPEQLRNSKGVDARADIFSVGVMLYEVLTGGLPTAMFQPASQITQGTPPEFDPVIAKCIAHDPQNRFQNAGELRAALGSVGASGRGGRRKLPASKAGKSRGMGLRAAGTAAILALLASAGVGIWELEGQRGAAGLVHVSATAPATQERASGAAGKAAALDEIETLIRRIRIETEDIIDDDAPPSITQTREEAESLWERAMALRDREPDRAFDAAYAALQCFAALILWPDPGMVFVYPGEVTIEHTEGTETVHATYAVEGFFIDATETTNAQYYAFCRSAPGGWPLRRSAAAGMPEHPVSRITYYDAQAYAAWAGKKLPTEAQWRRAAFGPEPAPKAYPWGEAWEEGASNGAQDDEYPYTAPVAAFESDATAFGCYDMCGNISEWTRTPRGLSPNAGCDGCAYFGTQLVVCGGNYAETNPRLDRRLFSLYEEAYDTLGFRCVVELPKGVESIAAGIETKDSGVPQTRP